MQLQERRKEGQAKEIREGGELNEKKQKTLSTKEGGGGMKNYQK